ncbi:MAG: helix-turn-helix domain-containing protein [Tessaracoccus sp.]
MPIVEVTENEKNVLMAWKKRSDTLILIRLKAEAVLYVSEGVAPEIVAKLVDRSVKTVQGWLRDWRNQVVFGSDPGTRETRTLQNSPGPRKQK